jgi:copper homeostasis protein (lipoprotein)
MLELSRLACAVLLLSPVLAHSAGTTGPGGAESGMPAGRLFGGELRYLADAALLTECKSGNRYPVAMEADWIALERAYLANAPEPGGPLYVTFEGSVAARPKMEGDGTEATVIVRRYINVWPDMRCERAMVDASLTNTYWRVVRLGDETVAAAEGRREPHLLLRAEAEYGQYRATVGCNQIMGGYAIDGDSLRFTPGPTTLMACPPPLAALERALIETLTATSRWRVMANTLELYDDTGAPLALFEAVYF